MKRLRKITLALLIVTAAINSQAQPVGRRAFPARANTDSIKNKFLDIPYASKSSAQKLDIYLPNKGSGPFPVIISIHGGAFLTGDKAMAGQINPVLEGLKRGYAVVGVNYRLSGEAKFPAAVEDVKAAVRFIRANSKKYNLNTDTIAAWGSSAGGYLAAMLGTTGEIKDFEDLSLGNPKVSSSVQAVVDWYGPIRFDTMDSQFQEAGVRGMPHGEANSPESKFLGQAVNISPVLVKRADPSTYISKNDPPFFIQAGTRDPLIPYKQSILFYEDLKKVLGDSKVTIRLLEGAGHGGIHFIAPENLEMVFRFLDKHLK